MTFDYSAAQEEARDRARAAADGLAPQAAGIDARGDIPAELARDLAFGPDAVALVAAVEELAVASAAVAVSRALGRPAQTGDHPMPGLRGAACGNWEPARGRLVLAAVALGVGRAALAPALSAFGDAQSGIPGRPEPPHWKVADAATALEAARLLTLKAAGALDRGADALGDSAVAKLMATSAAEEAVEAALAMLGPSAYTPGSTLERLSRDARTLALLMGTDEDQRVIAASVLLPG